MEMFNDGFKKRNPPTPGTVSRMSALSDLLKQLSEKAEKATAELGSKDWPVGELYMEDESHAFVELCSPDTVQKLIRIIEAMAMELQQHRQRQGYRAGVLDECERIAAGTPERERSEQGE